MGRRPEGPTRAQAMGDSAEVMGSRSIGHALSEVFNSPLPAALPLGNLFAGTPGVRMRQVAYDGGLWYLTGWMDLKDATGRWYVSMRLESAGRVIYVEEETLHFQQTLLPSLPWVEMIPAPRRPGVLIVSQQARRQATR